MYGEAMLPGLNALRRDHGLPEIASPIDHVPRPTASSS
jgi:hypothetical protein